MAQPNNISVVLDDQTLAEVKQAIGVLRTKLVPVLKSLPLQDRKELPKLGDKTSEFVRKSFEYSGIHPDLVPAFLDRTEFRIDLEALSLLQTLDRELAPVVAGLDDSIVLTGSEAYQAALVFYNNVRMAKKANVPGAAAVYDDLSTRFPGATAKNPSKRSL
jgi:hypothetical protein